MSKFKKRKNLDEHIGRFAARRALKSRACPKMEDFDDSFVTVEPIKGVMMRSRNLSTTISNEQLVCHPDCMDDCMKRKLVPLAATMYVYHCKG